MAVSLPQHAAVGTALASLGLVAARHPEEAVAVGRAAARIARDQYEQLGRAARSAGLKSRVERLSFPGGEGPAPKRARRSAPTAAPAAVSGSRFSYSSNMARVVRKRRVSRRKSKVPGHPSGRAMVRSSDTLTLTATGVSAIGTVYIPKLNAVETADLITIWKQYRLEKCVLHLVPVVDAGSQPSQYVAWVGAAADPERGATPVPASPLEITAYENSYQKWLLPSDHFTYTFYPKVVSAVYNGGATSASGSFKGRNPWLQCNAAGIQIDHQSLLLYIKGTNPAANQAFSYYVDYYFTCDGIS